MSPRAFAPTGRAKRVTTPLPGSSWPTLITIWTATGELIRRHDGRGDGPVRLDALLGDEAAMARITKGLTNGNDVRL